MRALKDIGDGGSILDEVGESSGSSRFAQRIAAAGKGKFSPVAVGSVVASSEFLRILALPRRVPDWTRFDDVTDDFRRPGSTMRLLPIQSAALIEAALMNGLFAPIGCGDGKSLITYLLPTALDSKKAVLLIPPALRDKVKREVREVYGKHFNLPMDRITVVAYSELSSANTADVLDRVEPDLIIADECHMLAHASAARTKRFRRYMKEHPECRFCGLSGTIASRSIKNFSHLIELALRKSSPLPHGWREVTNWAGALDVKPEFIMRPGALKRLCGPEAGGPEGEDVRGGFRRRFIESAGVVSSTDSEVVGASLVIRKIKTVIPDVVALALDEVREKWSINGDEHADIMSHLTALKQVACGFYYRLLWPGGVPDYEWLDARRAWYEAADAKLKSARAGMDSHLLLSRAVESGGWDCPAWWDWKAVKDRPEPPRETIWIDDYLCRDALKRANEYADDKEPCIIWCEHIAVGEKLAELSGVPYYGEGTDAEPTKHRVLIASRRVQGIGKNLQYHYSRNIFTLLCGGKDMEQTLARTHRLGQKADEVYADWYAHTTELEAQMISAQADARFQESLSGKQRLLYATHL
jgi:hypothetical protein